MKVVPAGDAFADFQCPSCGAWIYEEQSVFYPYEPHSDEVRLPCPGCFTALLITPQQAVTFKVRVENKAGGGRG